MIATMTSAGEMPDYVMVILIVAIAAVAFIPFFLGALGLAMCLFKGTVKWAFVGILVFLGWKMGGVALRLVKHVLGDKAEKVIAILEK